ncbi:amino acid/amide ABC transporter substrate-binding protein, HAAT family [Stanieria cyanosphaera PCC 7437]|uniref:Amino acid/amide ABC transporter substrate-binding protein, HAAT family n=1 Tax=Stanieria cyanosphaera (strain ATCC 29371 / PCC 7437) TaxID=111780 RepID=K9XNQ8_STAC7|nr:ABC transporter substrate-binding protein [Stanieria cyanosphaera]AFZ34245.1 amino acid/amide ABC transporter substrate-binding protein, HAAT family [Stanieria cyanosphaera PCC 7437]
MSQKNETGILLLSLLITIGLIGGGWWWFQQQENLPFNSSNNTSTSSSDDLLSPGNRVLITQNATPEKQAATAAIANNNYAEAISQLEASLKKQRNDPEALIYLNNARIGTQKAYTIAVAVPIDAETNAAQEILRGVAQAQTEINNAGGIKSVPLKVIISSDRNNLDTAQLLAQTLAQNPEILGVVGHFSSDTTLAASQVYQKAGLVMISPTSTSVDLSGVGNYIFRTVPSDRFAGNALAQYLLQQLKLQQAAVFYNSASSYSNSLKNIFTTDIFAQGGDIVGEFDLGSNSFNAADAVRQAQQQKAQALVLLANSATLDPALLVIQVNNRQLPLLGGDSLYKPQTLQIAGSNAVDLILAVPWHILADPNSSFPQTATRLWGGEVNWRTALAYDATQALIAGLERNPTRQGLQQALSAKDFVANGASGKIRFLPSGDRNQAVQLVKVVKGNRSGFGYDFVPLR